MKIEQQKIKLQVLVIALTFLSLPAFAQNLPTNPVPGKCYAKCITQDEYKEVEERIMIYPEHKKLKVTPATYKTVEERVLVKEATKKITYVPAVFETIDVSYVSKEKRTDMEVVAAVFGKDSKTIETAPKYGRWEYTMMDDCPSANKEDCMVACFVEYPNQEETVPMTVLTSDANTRNTEVAEVPATYKRQVIKEPARTVEEEIPAVYATIKKQVIDQPAKVAEEVVPAQYKTVTRRELVKKGGETVWEEIDCSLVGNNNVLPILYEYNSAAITADSRKIIDDNLLKLMNDKPNIRIQIMSHTDSRGNDDYNMELSEQRAKSVVDYLVSKGISRNRLESKGFGESRLKNKCSNGVSCTAAQHQANRRTEFKIL